MSVRGRGIRLRLLAGPTIPAPVSYEVADALRSVQVRSSEAERDGFQLTFAVGKRPLQDLGLVRDRTLEPPARIAIVVTVGTRAETVLDGIVSRHEVVPGAEPGGSTLVVSGEDLTGILDREPRLRPHSQQSDSAIVERILGDHDFQPKVKRTDDTPADSRRIPRQTGTDLEYVRRLAEQNGFVFYLEPTDRLGNPLAYWGPPDREVAAQPPLNVALGPETNVDGLRFGFDALWAATPLLSVIDPDSKDVRPVSAPDAGRQEQSNDRARPLRTAKLTDVARRDSVQAALRALSFTMAARDPVDASGTLDVIRYGRLLRRGRPVEVRGAGRTYDGPYYVSAVTHDIAQGSYRQEFQLRRDGRGAPKSKVSGR